MGLSDRNPTWPLKPWCAYRRNHRSEVSVIEILRGHSNWRGQQDVYKSNCLSDRNPTWPLKHVGEADINSVMVSVIEILRGHSNRPQKSKSISFHMSQWSKSYVATQTVRCRLLRFHYLVSVIEILRGHSNSKIFTLEMFSKCLSDRNPTWPLKPVLSLSHFPSACLSDRNPTWPLKLANITGHRSYCVSVIEILRGHSNLLVVPVVATVDVSVIEILRGHSNKKEWVKLLWPSSQWSKSYVATQTSGCGTELLNSLSQWSKSYVATQTTNLQGKETYRIVSVIEILRGHSNCEMVSPMKWVERLSDRNPTWPLKQLFNFSIHIL